MAKQTAAASATYILRAVLKPRLYRDIEIARDASLHALAMAIVDAYGFDFDHAFGFYSKLTGNIYQSPVRYDLFADIEGTTDAGSVKRTPTQTAFPGIGRKMTFLFDFGDEWRFKVEVIGAGETMPKTRYPKVVAKAGEAPPQYPDPEDDE